MYTYFQILEKLRTVYKGNKLQCAAVYGVARITLRDWRANEAKWRAMRKKSKRFRSATGPVPKYVELERVLAA